MVATLILCCWSCLCLKGQVLHGTNDSLEHILKSSKSDTNRINAILAFYPVFRCEDSLTSKRYLESALSLSKTIQWNKGIIEASFKLAYLYRDCYDGNQKLFEYFKDALAISKRTNDTARWLFTLNNLATAEAKYGKYKTALFYYGQAIGLTIAPYDRMTLLGNMGGVYYGIGDFQHAYIFYDSSLKILEEYLRKNKNRDITDTGQLCGLLVKIGSIYTSMFQYDKALENYDKVLNMPVGNKGAKQTFDAWALLSKAAVYEKKKEYSKAISHYVQALSGSQDSSDIITIHNRLANIYLNEKSLDTAMSHARKALTVATLSGITQEKSSLFITIGKILTERKKFDSSVYFLKQALRISKEDNTIELERDAWNALSIVYKQMNKPALALEAYENFIVLRDSIYNIDAANKFTRLDLQSEYDRQKQANDAIAQLKMEEQRRWTYGGFAGLGLVAVLSFFIYRNYTNQKKANVLITVEKENAEVQRQRAERSEQFKQQFLANMSHEIRTPMNAVSGMTDLLLEKQPRPDQLNYLQVISKSSDILLHIINDILDLSKIEAGKLEMEQIDFSLSDTVDLVKQTLSVKAEEKGLHLITSIDSTATDILAGDPYRLNQVLINLGGNAIKFTERGTVEISVKKTAEDDTTISLEFAVQDTGAGIPEDKLNDLFESFKQVNRSDTRKYGGTGLGLSISKQLVELQGGAISVDSKVGSGTTFSFIIQFHKGSAERLADRMRGEQQADGSVLYGLRILLADDNEYNRLVASEALNLKAKVVIHEAHNGEEAVQMLTDEDYDVVLMDVQMPVMNGLDATRAIRSQLPAPKNQTPVIALTASMLRNDLDKCIQAGMNTYVPKPFKTSQLIAAIAQVTGRIGYIAPPEAHVSTKEVSVTTLSISSKGGVTDLAALIKFCEGEEDRIKKYISIYLRAVPGFEEKAKAAITSRNMEKIATLAHTFKPKWMMMGMEASADLARKIEALSFENGDVDIACQYLSTLIEHNTLSVPELERNV